MSGFVPERLSTGIAGLDAVPKGGFIKGGLYIIQGAPGAGKTTIGNQLCFHQIRLQDGADEAASTALYVTPLAEYYARMLQNLSSLAFFDIALATDAVPRTRLDP